MFDQREEQSAISATRGQGRDAIEWFCFLRRPLKLALGSLERPGKVWYLFYRRTHTGQKTNKSCTITCNLPSAEITPTVAMKAHHVQTFNNQTLLFSLINVTLATTLMFGNMVRPGVYAAWQDPLPPKLRINNIRKSLFICIDINCAVMNRNCSLITRARVMAYSYIFGRDYVHLCLVTS